MSKTIMIVEDEKHFHDLYSLMLEDTDYEIIQAYDGDDALSKLGQRKPDLIILDMLLNMLSGDTFFLYIKNMHEYTDIPVIVASSVPKIEYRNLFETEPKLVFLEKTFTRERLLEEIKTKIG